MKLYLIGLVFASIFIILVLSLLVFGTKEGIELLHKKTNVVCNIAYNEDLKGWGFKANSTSIFEFIRECESRGIGVGLNALGGKDEK